MAVATLPALLAATTARCADRGAIVDPAGTLTWQALEGAIASFAAQLSGLSVGAGSCVVVLVPNGAEFVIATFAIARLGAIAVPLNPLFQPGEIAYYLRDSAAHAVVTTPSQAEALRGMIGTERPDCVVVTSVPRGGSSSGDVGDVPAVDPDADVLYQYSSGSTGTPKRVMRTQRQLVTEALGVTATTGVTPDDRILAVVPLFHAHGFGNGMLAAVATGATLHLLPAFKRGAVLKALTDQRITIFPAVPFMFGMLADSPSIAGESLPDLRLAFSAGAPLERKTFAQFRDKFGVSVRQLYGSTETGAVAINLGDVDGERCASIGQPVEGVEIRVVDDEGRDCGPGVEGEIVIRSHAMTRGYANLPEVNRESFRDGAFWTGDLGHADAEGYLFITGRKRLFINAGGNKVDPGQVEAVIAEHDAVAECVVVGVRGEYGQEIIKAVVVPHREVGPEEIRDWCRGRLAEFRVPRIVEFRPEIPRSPLGKILRKYLQEDFKAG